MATSAQDNEKTPDSPRKAPARRGKAATAPKISASKTSGTAGGKAGRTKRPASRTSRLGRLSGGVGVRAGTVLGAAAAGLAAGLVANLGRKAAVQAPSLMAGDWMEALKAEHKAALALFDLLGKTTPKQATRRALLLTQLKHALGKHAFTEENVIYPALREWGDKADADQLNHEHGYVKQSLYELETMDKSAPGFADKVADFRADLEKHIGEEEDKIFPQLHAALTAEKNKTLTAMANKEGFKLA